MPRIDAATASRISLVIDPAFAANATEQIVLGPIWLVASPVNRQLAKQLWRRGNVLPSWITVFEAGWRQR